MTPTGSRIGSFLLAMALAAAPAGAAAAGGDAPGGAPAEPKLERLRARLPRARVDRPREVVIVRGKEIGWPGSPAPINRLRVMVFRLGEEWVAAPFQIDERDAEGAWIWPPAAPDAVAPAAGGDAPGGAGLLTPEDELVFRPRDLGIRVARTAWPEDAAEGVEIEVRDPLTGGRGWAYLFRFEAPPPLAAGDDVRAYSSVVGDSFVTPCYRVFYPRRRGRFLPGVMTELAIDGSGRERHGPNLLDREKLRYTGSDRFLPGVGFRRDEDRIEARPLGVIDGPLRAIRKIERRVRFRGWFDGKVESTGVYLADRMILEEPNGFPWAMRFLVRRLSAVFYWDFAPPPGSLLRSDPVPLGVPADGEETPVEAALPGLPSAWWALETPEHGTLLAVYRPAGGDAGADLGPALFFRDGAAPDPPERTPGTRPAVGWEVPEEPEAKAAGKPAGVHLFVLDYFTPERQETVLRRIRAPLRVRAGAGLAR